MGSNSGEFKGKLYKYMKVTNPEADSNFEIPLRKS
jgi:hypothetical protein